ncbi:hypothetical protein COCNU_scaffold000040G000020 [Cocos nucifera]|nr:hypothetical protein [Cocos nucifera]
MLSAASNPTKLYRGVRQRHWGKWVAQIRLPHNRTRFCLGTFDTAKDATLACDREAFKLMGENARLNLFLGKRCGGGDRASCSSSSSSTLATPGEAQAQTQHHLQHQVGRPLDSYHSNIQLQYPSVPIVSPEMAMISAESSWSKPVVFSSDLCKHPPIRSMAAPKLVWWVGRLRRHGSAVGVHRALHGMMLMEQMACSSSPTSRPLLSPRWIALVPPQQRNRQQQQWHARMYPHLLLPILLTLLPCFCGRTPDWLSLFYFFFLPPYIFPPDIMHGFREF